MEKVQLNSINKKQMDLNNQKMKKNLPPSPGHLLINVCNTLYTSMYNINKK